MKPLSFYEYEGDRFMSDKTIIIRHEESKSYSNSETEGIPSAPMGFNLILYLIGALWIICALVEWSASI